MIGGAVAQFVSVWEPAVAVDDADLELVGMLRSWVVAAGPRSVREARCALRWGFEYLTASGADAAATVPAVVFAAGPVEAYLDTLDAPTGTKDAIRSHLRRMHPSIGFAGTTRRTANTATVDLAPTEAAPAKPASADDRTPVVTGLLQGWTPAMLPTERWERVAELVTTAVAACDVRTKARASDLARCVAYLAAWADSACRTMRAETVLSGGSIEEFVAVLAGGGVPVGSLRTFAANLHAVRAANGFPLEVTRAVFPKADLNEPYTLGEVADLYEHAARIRHPQRRWHAIASLDLMFGVGAFATETAHVRPGDVTTLDGVVLVTLSKPDRAVPVFARYSERLTAAAAAAETAGDVFVLGGTSRSRRNRLRQILGPTSLGEGGVPVSGSRARATWLVEAATTPGMFASMAELWAASGLRTIQAFELLAEHIHPAHTRRRHLADILQLPTADTTTTAAADGEWEVAS